MMDPAMTQTGSRPRTRSRWLWPLLIASLSANVLLASYALTLTWRLDLPLVDATSPLRILPRAASLLDSEDRAIAERAFAERQADLAHTEAGVQAARARVIELLQAPELHPRRPVRRAQLAQPVLRARRRCRAADRRGHSGGSAPGPHAEISGPLREGSPPSTP